MQKNKKCIHSLRLGFAVNKPYNSAVNKHQHPPFSPTNPMAFDSRAVANFFLQIAKEERQSLTPMKLQKLVYFAHGWHLAITQKPLIHEQVEAWSFGPVIRTVYDSFKHFGKNPITEFATREVWDWEKGMPKVQYETPQLPDDESEDVKFTKDLLRRIWEVYGGYTDVQLSNMTHEPGTPWDQVFQDYQGDIPRSTDIPRKSLQEYFQTLATENAHSS